MSTPNGYSPAVAVLGDQIKQMQARIAQLERSQRSSYSLANSSIDGGSITINDDDGNTRQVIGSQPDGTVTITEVGANPPGTPNAPVLGPVAGGLVTGWDGLLDNAQPLSDFLWTEVHISTVSGFTPDTTTLRRTMQAGGIVTIAGLDPSVVYYAVLVGVNRSRTPSPPSPQSSAQPLSTAQTLTPGSIGPGLLSFTAGGTTVSVGGSAPVGPSANDLWFNTANGNALSQWNGTAWAPYQFGTQAIAPLSVTTALLAAGAVTAGQILAGTITANEIHGGTITAALLQTGIVVAQIVDGTVVTGTTLQNSSTNPRTSINPDGSITIINAAGIAVLVINPDGTLHWHDGVSGNLLMQLSPAGTQEIYASLTSPASTDFEPPSAPAVLFAASTGAVSATTYANTVTQAIAAGQVVTVVASAVSTTAATGVTDSQGNTYTLVQSSTTGQYQQVFQAVNVNALGVTDTITVTFAAANTQDKNIIAVATGFGPTVTPLDFSAQATGTGTTPSVTGTPTAYGDALLVIASWANLGAPGTAMTDGWQLDAQLHDSGQHWTGVWYSTNNAPSGSNTWSVTITGSQVWAAVMLGYLASPAQPLSTAPQVTAASLSTSTLWADDGAFSARVTKVGTATSWGIIYPPFTVQAGSYIASRVVIGTLNIALGAVEIGFTYWSGPNGTGTNLGNSFITPGALTFNTFNAWTIYNSLVPPTAQSATFYVMERQADTAGNWFLVDGQSVPGGLAYSNSPFATTDSKGNPVPQGINFVGLPSLTDVFGVTDPYKGTKLANIDGQGNITGQVVSGVSDLVVRGQSVPDDLISPLPLGLINYGYMAVGGTAWPGTAIGTTEVPLWELDADLSGGRVYEFVMNQTIINTGGAASAHLRLRFTTDGSTPTTSSSIATLTASRCETAATDALIGPLRCVFAPGSDATYKFLITGNTGASTFQFKNDTFVRMQIYDLGGNTGQVVNNLVTLGTGSSGGTSQQAYTETFYPSNTYSYDQWGLKNHNGSMYQGTYNGGYDQHSWISWANGSRGNSLSTVLNYTVTSVKLRLLNLHSWYNAGMTVSLHYGNAGSSPGDRSNISLELTNWHTNEGQLLTHTLGSADWAAWKTAGRWAVLRAGSGTLDRYGFFYGGGGSTGSMPQMTVKYLH